MVWELHVCARLILVTGTHVHTIVCMHTCIQNVHAHGLVACTCTVFMYNVQYNIGIGILLNLLWCNVCHCIHVKCM